MLLLLVFHDTKAAWRLSSLKSCCSCESLKLHFHTLLCFKVQYHKDFEASRGHYIAVTDDPEMKRAQRSSEIASQVAYTQHSSGQSRLGIHQRTANGLKINY